MPSVTSFSLAGGTCDKVAGKILSRPALRFYQPKTQTQTLESPWPTLGVWNPSWFLEVFDLNTYGSHLCAAVFQSVGWNTVVSSTYSEGCFLDECGGCLRGAPPTTSEMKL